MCFFVVTEKQKKTKMCFVGRRKNFGWFRKKHFSMARMLRKIAKNWQECGTTPGSFFETPVLQKATVVAQVLRKRGGGGVPPWGLLMESMSQKTSDFCMVFERFCMDFRLIYDYQ